MRQDILKRWLEKLRSNEYKQCKSYLCRVSPGPELSYCCLGVLCDIVKDDIGLQWEQERFYANINRQCYSLPSEVIQYCDLDSNNPTVQIPEGHRIRKGLSDCKTTLANLNDSYGLNFKEIADIIEYNFLEKSVEVNNNV